MQTNDSAESDSSETTLVTGANVALRRWDREPPADWKPDSVREYEVVGIVLSGKAELRIDGRIETLTAGGTYIVPPGTTHSYKILESFTSIEAVSPAPQS